MRTKLAIDNDVLMAAKELAETQRKSVGEVISMLVRRGTAPRRAIAEDTQRNTPASITSRRAQDHLGTGQAPR